LSYPTPDNLRNRHENTMEFLKELGIKTYNPGAYLGDGEWSTCQDKGIIESINPANGETIAAIYGASAEDY
jgi:aldehyde dehydrogenase (NAD+)